MKFYIYIFYRMKDFHKYKNPSDGWTHAFLLIGGIWVIHILTLLCFIQTYIGREFVSQIRIDNGIIDRFVLFPLLIAPIYIVIYAYYKRNKAYVKSIMRDFRKESEKERKQKGAMVVCYWVVSFLLLILSIMSPIFFR